MEELLKVSRDVYYTPIYMKKNRPAYKLSVICDTDKEDLVEELIFTNTTSIGVRKIPITRSILDRSKVSILYEGINLLYKKVKYKDTSYCYPEYESALKLAKAKSMPIKLAYKKMNEIYGDEFEKEN